MTFFTQVDEFIKKKEKEGTKVTYTGVALKAIGNAFTNAKEYHGKIVFGRFQHIEDVDVYTLVNVEDGKNLAGLTVRQTNKQSISQLMEQMHGSVSKIKSNKDDAIKKQTGLAP